MRDLKEKLNANENIYGTLVTEFYTPNIAKMLDVSGFDFFMIDCEHGYFDYTQVANIIAVGNGIGIPVLVRIPEVNKTCILRYLEMGAAGLMIPGSESAEQLENVIKYSKYAPMGERGVSLSRPHTGYGVANGKEYMECSNKKIVIIAQIESKKGIENIDEILSVAGVDIALLGPNDLSQDMNMLGQFYEDSFVQAIQKVVDSGKKNNKYVGIHASGIEYVQFWKERGMNILMWNSDITMMIAKAKEGINQLKSGK